jgi:hypothetical protein
VGPEWIRHIIDCCKAMHRTVSMLIQAGTIYRLPLLT